MAVVIVHSTGSDRPAHSRGRETATVEADSRPGQIDRTSGREAHRGGFQIIVVIEGPLVAIGEDHGHDLRDHIAVERSVVVGRIILGLNDWGTVAEGLIERRVERKQRDTYFDLLGCASGARVRVEDCRIDGHAADTTAVVARTGGGLEWLVAAQRVCPLSGIVRSLIAHLVPVRIGDERHVQGLRTVAVAYGSIINNGCYIAGFRQLVPGRLAAALIASPGAAIKAALAVHQGDCARNVVTVGVAYQ